ncbi:hypothetical protein F441_00523 [Phytophthora nicotianae CJ01A1]|uniref:RxLR effector protein n=7 Tax=Phytophthora nicotianae TaxID=4792 RepID=W2RH38_PHYN3|nr:hypothetical protein PPTG_00432 [Phytophthora nicotianae INRA-310]ETI57118.1 hypothetical protein F443_00525 [Phytophthora nicotianae P1569]ETK96879.1 hypothetical protein L915_00500 [Phytophthora nicotianae]ETO85854.1 hypothetical protein F444_00522 [Phytophthora nicotianae P1976]ETP26884.1 hypothetical protein F441_00523 [Phytophthora nicotianae CJ01A1]ETP54850.1 hypothetical protein F442_00516 [Phytophthora nicotianae P10297]
MRLRCVYGLTVILAVVTLATSVGASSVDIDSKMVNPTAELALTYGMSDTKPKRLLRAEKFIEEGGENEERGAFSNIVAKVKGLVKVDPKRMPVVPKGLATVREMPDEGNKFTLKLKDFLNKQKSLDDVYSLQVKGKKGKKLLEPDALPMYIKFSELTAAQRGGKDMYGINALLNHVPEKDLLEIAIRGMKSTDKFTVATADRVRAGLISKWWSEKLRPHEVASLLKGGDITLDKVHKEVARLYLNTYNKVHITTTG